MGREPGLKRFKISPSNDRFLIAETSSGIITIRTKKKKKETFQRIGDLKNLTMEKGVRKTEKKKERRTKFPWNNDLDVDRSSSVSWRNLG